MRNYSIMGEVDMSAEQTREAVNDNQLEERIERFLNKAYDSGKRIVAHSSGVVGGVGALAYFEDEAAPVALTKSEKKQLERILGRDRKLPDGYRPLFKSMSDYLRGGIRNTDQWREACQLSGQQIAKAYGDLTKANAYSSIDSESAGALILPEFAPEIADIVYNSEDLLSKTDQYTISGDSLRLPKTPQRSRKRGSRNSGVTAGWPDQGDLIDVVRGKIEATELALKKLACVVFLNSELISDQSYAIEQWVKKSVSSEMSFLVNDALVNGVGSGMPLGYLQSGRLIKVTRTQANSIQAADILNMYKCRIPGVNLNEYEWHINQEAESELFKMTLGTGGAQLVVYQPPGGLSAAPYSTLMGIRVRTMEFNSALGTTGDIALVRMKGISSITKGGVNETASSHVGFMRDQDAIKFTMRLDARPTYDTPTLAFKGSNNFSYSDFIALT